MESNTDGGIQQNIDNSGIQNFFMDSYSTGNSNSSTTEKTDPYGIESNGTVKFMGSNVGSSGGEIQNENNKYDFHTIKSNNTTIAKVRTEQFSKIELINMLCHLEGELQARDVVIAVLRNERVKNLIQNLHINKNINLNDPNAALFRDKISSSGNFVSRQSSITVAQAELEVRAIIEQQMESLYQMVIKQRSTHSRMVNFLTESLDNNQRIQHELDDEKRKHEHDTAQGDDITYGLEIERTKLKQELEQERNNRKKLEKDVKKIQENLEFEKNRQKQIVLLLLAERKKIIMKYIEERKRSEDLAQILSEEKQRSDTIAEGLEEESKKSLRMEAELEKQTNAFENERKRLAMNLALDEKRIKELEAEVLQLKNAQLIPVVPGKVRTISSDPIGAPTSVVNVAKIVQPTATVSSVPVSGPTTGIARSVNSSSIGGFSSTTAKLTRKVSQQLPTSATQLTSNNNSHTPAPITITSQQLSQNIIATIGIAEPLTSLGGGGITSSGGTSGQQIISTDGGQAVSLSSSTTISQIPVSTLNASSITTQTQLSQQSNLIKHGGSSGTNSGFVNSNTVPIVNSNLVGTTTITSIPTNNILPSSGVRGVPPPIPPNKPVVPPKREPSVTRMGSTTIATTNNIK